MAEQPEAPIGICCGQRHYGSVCPDGLVMCQACFHRFARDDLSVLREGDRSSAPIHEDMCRTCKERDTQRGVSGDAPTAETAHVMEPWAFEMGDFESCSDRNPDQCACATRNQPMCEVCGQEIDPGEQAWARLWPRYNTLSLDHPDQGWNVISWHNDCCPNEQRTRPGGRT